MRTSAFRQVVARLLPEETKGEIDVLIRENQHVTVRKKSAENELEPRAVEEIVEISEKWKIFPLTSLAS
jgi:hypothetical protein